MLTGRVLFHHRRIQANEGDSVAVVIQKVIGKEQLEFAMPAMYRLVRCGNVGVTRDGSEPVRATLPRSGVIDVLTRTVMDYGVMEGDILAMQVSHRLRAVCLYGAAALLSCARCFLVLIFAFFLLNGVLSSSCDMQDAMGFKMDALRGTQLHPLR